MQQLISIKEASKWATGYLGKQVTMSNISYLIQYGRIKKNGINGKTLIDKDELKTYYKSTYKTKENNWKNDLGEDLNWTLSFSEYKESETTKHVHRLHPYKGKFIPQLVEYFLDDHTDEFKKEIFFKKGDIVLDPFCGSGTTLVQANELGLHAIGVDVSIFNALISNVKVLKHDIFSIYITLENINHRFAQFQEGRQNNKFEEDLLEELKTFNSKFFPSPEFKRRVRQNKIDEKSYGKHKEVEFLCKFIILLAKSKLDLIQDANNTFMDKWFLQPIREEIDFLQNEINQVKEIEIRRVIEVILSRTVRSCRATKHSDLGSLKTPISATYYCKKHGKICKPLFSAQSWWIRYCKDTINRLVEFQKLRTNNTYQFCIIGDSRKVNVFKEIENENEKFDRVLRKNKINGIFSSPPYVGLIDYHTQHAYSYDLFNLERKDELEIGPLANGQGKKALEEYVIGIAEVLNNCKKFLQNDYDVFLVANDKYNLYPRISELAGMKIVHRFKRPVLNRVEKDRSAYSEIIFHLKEA